MPEKIVLCQFLKGPGAYAYFVPDYLSVERGDLVVVEARDTYAVARVFSTGGISAEDMEKASKYIVQTIDVKRLETYKDGWYQDPDLGPTKDDDIPF